MFEHFRFGAQPQTQHQLLDDAFPSPTDTSFPPPLTPPPTSFPFPQNLHQVGINDIVAKFSQQSLQRQSRDQLVQQFQAWQSDEDFGPPEVDEEEMDTPSERIIQTASLPSTPVLPSTSTVACRRLQRQLNVQLQTSSSHIRDINALVEDMIMSNSQCTLRKATSRAYLSSPPSSRGPDAVDLMIDPSELDESRLGNGDIDEGFCDDERFGFEEEMELSLRRASMPSGIRKYNGIKYGRSVDVVNIGGRAKIRSLPRMRKRKVPSVPE